MKWFVVVAVAGCGRIGFSDLALGDGGSNEPFAITVPATQLPATAVKFTSNHADAVWTADAGTISADGVFVAPSTEGAIGIHATSGTETLDAEVSVTLSITAVVVGETGTMLVPSGHGSQTHGFYSAAQKQWWVVYSSSQTETQLRATSSPDFKTFVEGPAVDLQKTIGEGRDLDVAYRVLNGHEVVHVSEAYEQGFGRVHLRGELTGAGLQWGAPLAINTGGQVTPDGTAVAITESGQVIDSTGYLPTPQTPPLTPCGNGDVVMYTADQLDDGTTSFDTMTYKQEVIWCVPTYVNARWLGTDGDTIYQLYEDGLGQPDTQNIKLQIRKSDQWLPIETTYTVPPNAFGTDATTNISDWSATIVGRAIHAVRRNNATVALEHAVLDLDGSGAFIAGGMMGNQGGTVGSGVIVAPYGEGVIAAQISANQILYAFYRNGEWSKWFTLSAPSSMGRTGLSAIANGPDAKPALLWTDTVGTSLDGAALP
ncbi:MAG: hypothetical protein QM831_15060 [Kofleriaceae bacterium]